MHNLYHLRKLFAPSTPGHGPYWKANLVATMVTKLIRGMAGLTSGRLDQQVWERERRVFVCLLAQSAILPAVVWAVCDTTAQLVPGTRTAALTRNRAGAGEIDRVGN